MCSVNFGFFALHSEDVHQRSLGGVVKGDKEN